MAACIAHDCPQPNFVAFDHCFCIRQNSNTEVMHAQWPRLITSPLASPFTQHNCIGAYAVAKSDPDPGGAVPADHASPPSAKRPIKSAGLQNKHTPTAKKAETHLSSGDHVTSNGSVCCCCSSCLHSRHCDKPLIALFCIQHLPLLFSMSRSS